MRKIILGLALLISINGFGQKKPIEVISSEKTLGKSLVDSSAIAGVEYQFPDRIHETFLDTTTGFLTVQLRGVGKSGKWLNNTGTIVQYDMNSQKVLWSKKIAYQTSNLQQFSQTMIYTVANKSYCLDINTGDELWEVKNDLYFVNPITHIGIGYKIKSATGYSNELQGIELKSGDIVWKRDLNREYGWNDLFYTNDSTAIIVAAGLHAVNIKTGDGWDYNTITGKKDYTETAAVNALGIAAGLLTGTFVMATGHNVVRDLVSKAMIDSSFIYFASKEQLVKLDKQTGEVVWKFSIPDGFGSKSSIFLNDSTVYLLNKGMAFMGNRQLNFGKPFFAALDRQTGQQLFFTLINVEDNPILNYQIHDNEILFVFKNRIEKYSMENGDMLAGNDFPSDRFGELKNFIGNQVFIRSQAGDLLSLNESDSSKVFVYTSQKKILVIDSDLSVASTTDSEDLSIYYLRTGDFKLVAKDDLTSVVNRDGNRIAEIEASSNSFMIGSILYSTKDESFRRIDLSNILKSD